VYVMLLESCGDYLYVGVLSQQTRRMLMLCYCLLKLGLKSVGERMDKTVKKDIVLIISTYAHIFLDYNIILKKKKEIKGTNNKTRESAM